ncbi:MAG: hypothetical protein EA393_14575 [Bacteroidetes bacterium]|nr:MAG: hypothetical protein EA393_14575 [Bacteroidota bacterium]
MPPWYSQSCSCGTALKSLPTHHRRLSHPIITNYFWHFGDGDSINTPNAKVPKVYFDAKEFAKEGGQEYEITLTVTNEFGCDTTLTYIMLLREAPIFIPNEYIGSIDDTKPFFIRFT